GSPGTLEEHLLSRDGVWPTGYQIDNRRESPIFGKPRAPAMAIPQQWLARPDRQFERAIVLQFVKPVSEEPAILDAVRRIRETAVRGDPMLLAHVNVAW